MSDGKKSLGMGKDGWNDGIGKITVDLFVREKMDGWMGCILH